MNIRALARFTEVIPVVAFRGLNGGMPILIGLYIGHRWGLAALGAYTFAASFVAVGLMCVDWGCTRWIPRELALARLQGDSAGATPTANTIRLVLAAAFLLVTAAGSQLGWIPQESARYAMLLAFLCPIAIFSANGVSDRIVSREVGAIGVAVAGGLAVFGAAAVLAATLAPGALGLIAAYIVGKTAEAVLLMKGRSYLFRMSARHFLVTALALWPFSIQAILGVVYSRLSVFIVEHFRHADLGLIGAASALQNVLLLFPVSIALLKYPVLTSAAATGQQHQFRRVLAMAVAASVAMVTAGMLFLFLLRGIIGRTLHIPPALMPFVLVYVAVAYLTIGTALSAVLLQAIGRERITARLSFVTLAVSITAQYAFIRAFGLWGIAAGVAAAEMLSVIIFATAAWRSEGGVRTYRPHVIPCGRDVRTPQS
jgi:O-antigen/teichoic acid export membrane protein